MGPVSKQALIVEACVSGWEPVIRETANKLPGYRDNVLIVMDFTPNVWREHISQPIRGPLFVIDRAPHPQTEGLFALNISHTNTAPQ